MVQLLAKCSYLTNTGHFNFSTMSTVRTKKDLFGKPTETIILKFIHNFLDMNISHSYLSLR